MPLKIKCNDNSLVNDNKFLTLKIVNTNLTINEDSFYFILDSNNIYIDGNNVNININVTYSGLIIQNSFGFTSSSRNSTKTTNCLIKNFIFNIESYKPNDNTGIIFRYSGIDYTDNIGNNFEFINKVENIKLYYNYLDNDGNIDTGINICMISGAKTCVVTAKVKFTNLLSNNLPLISNKSFKHGGFFYIDKCYVNNNYVIKNSLQDGSSLKIDNCGNTNYPFFSTQNTLIHTPTYIYSINNIITKQLFEDGNQYSIDDSNFIVYAITEITREISTTQFLNIISNYYEYGDYFDIYEASNSMNLELDENNINLIDKSIWFYNGNNNILSLRENYSLREIKEYNVYSLTDLKQSYTDNEILDVYNFDELYNLNTLDSNINVSYIINEFENIISTIKTSDIYINNVINIDDILENEDTDINILFKNNFRLDDLINNSSLDNKDLIFSEHILLKDINNITINSEIRINLTQIYLFYITKKLNKNLIFKYLNDLNVNLLLLEDNLLYELLIYNFTIVITHYVILELNNMFLYLFNLFDENYYLVNNSDLNDYFINNENTKVTNNNLLKYYLWNHLIYYGINENRNFYSNTNLEIKLKKIKNNSFYKEIIYYIYKFLI